MSFELNIDNSQNEGTIYKQLSNQLEHLIDPTDKIISNLSNFTSALKQSFSKISWVGFYIRGNDKLFLGPFQGNTACTEIKIGNGVCGTSALNKQTI
ncbi:MAG: GAF domain-containing protein, partial [Chlorobi bacterium]|nr:GAF domain-containing protein [Chlorobiota bacterium]